MYGEDNYEKVITFVSNRSKGLVKAVTKVFLSAPHGFCLCLLEANFMKVNTRLGKALRDECWAIIIRIAYTCTGKEFDDTVSELESASI